MPDKSKKDPAQGMADLPGKPVESAQSEQVKGGRRTNDDDDDLEDLEIQRNRSR